LGGFFGSFCKSNTSNLEKKKEIKNNNNNERDEKKGSRLKE